MSEPDATAALDHSEISLNAPTGPGQVAIVTAVVVTAIPADQRQEGTQGNSRPAVAYRFDWASNNGAMLETHDNSLRRELAADLRRHPLAEPNFDAGDALSRPRSWRGQVTDSQERQQEDGESMAQTGAAVTTVDDINAGSDEDGEEGESILRTERQHSVSVTNHSTQIGEGSSSAAPTTQTQQRSRQRRQRRRAGQPWV